MGGSARHLESFARRLVRRQMGGSLNKQASARGHDTHDRQACIEAAPFGMSSSSRGFEARMRALDALLAARTAQVEKEGAALKAHLRTMDGLITGLAADAAHTPLQLLSMRPRPSPVLTARRGVPRCL